MKRTVGILTGLISAVLLSSPMLEEARAQNDALAAAQAGVRDLGKYWNRDVSAATRSLFVDLHASSNRSGVRVISDVSYGPEALQVLDLFVPEQRPATPAPIVIFVHGGALTRGDKVGPDGLIYSNVPTFYARHGMIGVNMNYRLVPDVKWPGGPEDIRSVLLWLRENIGEHGGDASKVFIIGNSAGATHIASYLFHEPTQIEGDPGVAGALLASGGFGMDNPTTNRAYLGDDESTWDANKPLGLAESYEGKPVPIFMWSTEFDPARIETPVAQMYTLLCSKYDHCPRFTQFQGHNHVSDIMSINSADTEVGEATLDFIQDVLEGPGAGSGSQMSAL
ncbi:MAG: alpha/beta hydrolase [Gammaproteobacteria bacterium]|nr:alpha/beta hydrolase [Gammaproteobacteria bacterium]